MARITLRRGTAAQWTAADSILASGEMGVETDTGMLKIGNGADPWSARPYVQGQPIPPGTPSWEELTDMPAVIAAGSTAAAARTAIEAAAADLLPELVASLPGSPVTGKLYCLPE
ncbi:hypothetical protein [Rhodococcus ruber]|uniref:hyaluronate lyase N-terminal domain-containing protein n=1 Tax=Rhodococcus ruber TaxID=1830 RepID=UPI003D819A8F